MVGWGAFEKALDRVGAHTNLVGKYWITTFNMLRKVVKVCHFNAWNKVNALFKTFKRLFLLSHSGLSQL